MRLQWSLRAANGLRPQAKSNPAGRIEDKTRLKCYSIILFLKYLPTSACMRMAASVRATG